MRINPIYSNTTSQKFSFPSTLQSIDSLEMLLNDLKEKFAISEQVYSSIWVSLNEAIVNAVVHGNKSDSSKKVHLSVELKWDNFICFTVKDEARGLIMKKLLTPPMPKTLKR
jgi:serine/threonine-protein kinase RsbW